MIKVFATGHIGNDAETRTVGQHTVTSFSIASTEKFKDKKVTTWLNCQKWNAGRLADYLTKGTKVEIFGKLDIKEKDSVKYTTCTIIELEFGGKPEKKPEQYQEPEEQLPPSESTDDDLPF